MVATKNEGSDGESFVVKMATVPEYKAPSVQENVDVSRFITVACAKGARQPRQHKPDASFFSNPGTSDLQKTGARVQF